MKTSIFNNGLVGLHEELDRAREDIRAIIRSSPEDLQAHRVHCLYAAKILEVYKTVLQARSLDPEKILIDALMSVVLVLNEKGEEQSAEVVGRHLESIEEKAKEKWRRHGEANWLTDTQTSEPSSNPPLELSEKPVPKKKKSAKPKL